MQESEEMPDQWSAILLGHLGAYQSIDSGPRPTFEELGLGDVWDLVKRCAALRAMANQGLTDPHPGVPLAEDRWRQIGGLFGSISESISLAAACEIEVELNRRSVEDGSIPPAMIMAGRFFSESQGQTVLGIGHRLANVAVRVLALRWRDEVQTPALRGAANDPWANDRDSWVSLNPRIARSLSEAAARIPHQSIHDLAAAISSLQASDEWRNLDDQRGEDFHRWRRETSVLAGVDATSGNVSEICDDAGNVIGKQFHLGPGTPYSEFVGIEEVVSASSHAAMLRVMRAVSDVVDAWEKAVEPASLGEHTIDSGRATRHFGSWSDSSCGCCV